MSAKFTLKFDGWAPDLQNVAMEVDGSSGAVPCADCLNVYYQDAAFRCLPAPNPFGPSLGAQALNLFSGYDNIAADNYVYAATTDGIQIFQDGAWTPVPVEPSVTVGLTGIALGLNSGGGSVGATKAISGSRLTLRAGTVTQVGGALYNGTMVAGANIGYTIFGYVKSQYGSINPTTTIPGATVTALSSYVGPTQSVTQLILSGTLPQNYFSTLVIANTGRSLPSSTVISFAHANNTTQWNWGSSLGFQNGQSYTVRLIS